eukprot:1869047-Rhodomonas_salina.1
MAVRAGGARSLGRPEPDGEVGEAAVGDVDGCVAMEFQVGVERCCTWGFAVYECCRGAGKDGILRLGPSVYCCCALSGGVKVCDGGGGGVWGACVGVFGAVDCGCGGVCCQGVNAEEFCGIRCGLEDGNQVWHEYSAFVWCCCAVGADAVHSHLVEALFDFASLGGCTGRHLAAQAWVVVSRGLDVGQAGQSMAGLRAPSILVGSARCV